MTADSTAPCMPLLKADKRGRIRPLPHQLPELSELLLPRLGEYPRAQINGGTCYVPVKHRPFCKTIPAMSYLRLRGSCLSRMTAGEGECLMRQSTVSATVAVRLVERGQPPHSYRCRSLDQHWCPQTMRHGRLIQQPRCRQEDMMGAAIRRLIC